MANLSLPYSDFVAGTTIVSAQVDANNTAITDYINARNSGSTSWDALASTAAITVAATSNQLVLGSTRTVTITAPTPASASRTHTIPDVSANASFVMSEGAQTINGVKTFGSQLVAPAGSVSAAGVAVRAANYGLYSAGVGEIDLTANGNNVFAADVNGVILYANGNSVLIAANSGVGLKGTTTNNNASAGFVGESVESNVTVSVAAPTSTQLGDLTSISLTAGDWIVTGTAAGTLNSSTCTAIDAGISTTSGNSTTGLTYGANRFQSLPPTAAADTQIVIATYRLSLSGTTTVYLKMAATYSAGTPRFYGSIRARRAR